jgi:GIY-YIG catalytic domain
MAAFNSMFHRLFSIPMDKKEFENEHRYIIETGRINGYCRQKLDKIFEKHKRKKEIQNLTNLQPIDEKEFKYISMPFCPPLTQKLDNQLKKHGYKIAYRNEGKLSDLLGSTKDKILEEGEKSGIYQIKCSKCDVSYIGQTKRKMKTRIKEHHEDCSKPPLEEKPMPKHAIENNHPFGEIKLLKEVRKPFELNAYESLLLHKHKNENLVNIQKEGNCPSVLYKYV